MNIQKEELLWKMNDRRLESQANHEIWLWEIVLGRPWAEAAWHRASKDEYERRGIPGILNRVKLRVLTLLREAESRINV
jgi:hypothetical protein